VEIAGKVAIVTGAGSGIGQAMALRLATLGASVLVADVDGAGGAETVRQATAAGGAASFIHVDVTSTDDLGRMIATAVQTYGALDILHNNAGITMGQGQFVETDSARAQLLVRTNLLGVILGTQAAVPVLREFGGGVILNTASAAGLRPWTNDPIYSATKAGVVFFTRALAPELLPLGIRINCVCPGVVRTPLVGKSVRVQSMSVAERAQFDATIAAMPLIEPAEVVDAFIDQITDESITGQARHVGRQPLPPEGQTIGGII
jgi:3-oxoacyl-[acyl-carrier protein] reductase